MSSITDSRNERGQILVIFAASLLVIFGVAALVFDGGMMLLEKRTQQNAADAASLAGARFLPGDPDEARAAAGAVATANGFTDGVDGETVTVNIPPTTGPNAGDDGYIEVLIDNETASFFAGIWGIFSHDVGSRAVAANDTIGNGPFALLSLDPTGCDALIVEGKGELISNGNIQVNSSCTPNALRLAGQGEIVTAPTVACNVVGEFSQGGPSVYSCEMNAAPDASVVSIPDPFLSLAEPPIPTDPGTGAIVYPQTPVQVAGATKVVPAGCPGGSAAATDSVPAECGFTGSYKDTTWRIYPGYYPGGIRIQGGDFYLEPGIYYVTGPIGFNFEGNEASAISVDAGGTTVGGGVLIFNGEHSTAVDGTISIRGGNTAGVDKVHFLPLEGTIWDSMVIFQDREVCNDVAINGAESRMLLRGVIYVPGNDACPTDHPVLIAEGNGGTVVTDQIIAFRFQMKGNIGSLTVAYDDEFTPSARVAGLVE